MFQFDENNSLGFKIGIFLSQPKLRRDSGFSSKIGIIPTKSRWLDSLGHSDIGSAVVHQPFNISISAYAARSIVRMSTRMKIRPDCYVYKVPLKNSFTLTFRLHGVKIRMSTRRKIRPDCYVYTVPLKNSFTFRLHGNCLKALERPRSGSLQPK